MDPQHALPSLLAAIPAFTGSQGDDPIRWIMRIERLAPSMGVSDEQKLALALAKLDQGAYDWSECNNFPTWNSFKSAFFARYSEDTKTVKQRLSRCRQAQSEGVRGYVDRFQALALRARLQDPEEILEKFLRGLQKELYDLVITTCPTTFDTALERAVYFEKRLRGNSRLQQTSDNTTASRQPFARPNSYPRPTPQGQPQPVRRYNDGGPRNGQTQPADSRENDDVSGLNSNFNRLKIGTRSILTPAIKSALRPQNFEPQIRHMMTRSIMSTDYDSASSDDEDFSFNQPLPHYPTTQNIVCNTQPETYTDESSDPEPTGNTATKEEAATTPALHAIGMRKAVDYRTHIPQIMERMEIDRIKPASKPLHRRPFSVVPQQGPNPKYGPGGDSTYPEGGPRVIRRNGPPPSHPAPTKHVSFQTPPPPAETTIKLSRNELRLLEDMFSTLKIRNLGPEEMTGLSTDRVLLALAQKIKELVLGRNLPPPILARPVDSPPQVQLNVAEVSYPKLRKRPLKTVSTKERPHSLGKYLSPSDGVETYFDVLSAKMRVFDNPVRAVIDTGATACGISLEFVRKLGLESAIDSSITVRYLNADGAPMLSAGVIRDAPVRLGELTQHVDLLVIPGNNTYGLLCGVDFLSPAKAVIDFNTLRLHYSLNEHQRGSVPLICTTNHPNPQKTIQMIQPPAKTCDQFLSQYAARLEQLAETMAHERLTDSEIPPSATTGIMSSPFADLNKFPLINDDVSLSPPPESEALSNGALSLVRRAHKRLTAVQSDLPLIPWTPRGLAFYLSCREDEFVPNHLVDWARSILYPDNTQYYVNRYMADVFMSPLMPRRITGSGQLNTGYLGLVSRSVSAPLPYSEVAAQILAHAGKHLFMPRRYLEPAGSSEESSPPLTHPSDLERTDSLSSLASLPSLLSDSVYESDFDDNFDSDDIVSPEMDQDEPQEQCQPKALLPSCAIEATKDYPPANCRETQVIRDEKIFTLQPSVGSEYTLLGRPIQMGKQLSDAEKETVFQLLSDYEDVFSKDSTQIGLTNFIMQEIETGDAQPIKQPPYRVSLAERQAMRAEIDKLLASGTIEPSSSPWASPVVMVPKKDPTQVRFTVNYTKLNAVTVSDSYPMPSMADLIDDISQGSAVWTVLDLRSAFFSVPIHPKDRPKTAFASPWGLYQFRAMAQGLKNSPACQQRLLSTVLHPLMTGECLSNSDPTGERDPADAPCCVVWLDDVCIYSPNLKVHLIQLKKCLDLLRDANLLVAVEKAQIACDEITYLGHVVSRDGVSPCQDKIDCLMRYPTPRNVSECRGLLGLAGWMRRFIQGFSLTAEPITRLLKQDVPFHWGAEQEAAFNALKKALTTYPVLRAPDYRRQFILTTDYSKLAIGGILSQEDDNGKEYVIAYASKRCNKHQANYSATDGELFAVREFIRHWRHLLYPQRFRIRTDHQALTWLLNSKNLTGRQARIQLELQGLDFEIAYRPGKENEPVDALSRINHDLMAPSPHVPQINFCMVEQVTNVRPNATTTDKMMQDLMAKIASSGIDIYKPHESHATLETPATFFVVHSQRRLLDLLFDTAPTQVLDIILEAMYECERLGVTQKRLESKCFLMEGEANPRNSLFLVNLKATAPNIKNLQTSSEVYSYLRSVISQCIPIGADPTTVLWYHAIVDGICSVFIPDPSLDLQNYVGVTFSSPELATRFSEAISPILATISADTGSTDASSAYCIEPCLSLEEVKKWIQLQPISNWCFQHLKSFFPVLNPNGTLSLTFLNKEGFSHTMAITVDDLLKYPRPYGIKGEPKGNTFASPTESAIEYYLGTPTDGSSNPETNGSPSGPFSDDPSLPGPSEDSKAEVELEPEGEDSEDLHPPLVICLEGLIGAGKSSTLELARSALEALSFSVHGEPLMVYEPELVTRFYEDPNKENTWAIQKAALDCFDYVSWDSALVIERSPDSSVEVFGRQCVRAGLLSTEDLEQLRLKRQQISLTPTVYIYVATNPSECLDRIHRRARAGEAAITLSLLENHSDLYEELFTSHPATPLHILDGTLPPLELATQMVRIAESYLPNKQGRTPSSPATTLLESSEDPPRENLPIICMRTTNIPAGITPSKGTKRPATNQDESGPSTLPTSNKRLKVGSADTGTPPVRTPFPVKSGPIQSLINNLFPPKPAPISISSDTTASPTSDDSATLESDSDDHTESPRHQPQRNITYLHTQADVDAVTCRTCNSPDDSRVPILLCGKCNAGYHLSCLQPPLSSVPSGRWICKPCETAAREEGALGVVDIVDDHYVLEYLKTDKLPVKPEDMTAAEFRSFAKRIRKRAKGYMAINDQLYKKVSAKYPKPRRIPAVEERPALIQRIHTEAGHKGATRTLYLLNKEFTWPGISVDVRKAVAECQNCQVQKASFKIKTELQPLPIVALFHRWHVDTAGPFRPSSKGNKHIILAIDSFSKWIECMAVPDISSSTLAMFAQTNIINRFGAPVSMHCDNGSSFKGEFEALMNKHGTIIKRSSAYTPSVNGAIERYCGVIVQSIVRSINTNLDEWCSYLQQSVLGHNFTRQESTQQSPFYMLYQCHPRYFDHQNYDNALMKLHDEAARERSEQRDALVDSATANMAKAQEKMKRDYSRKHALNEPLVATDSYVLVKRQRKGKLEAQAEGPYLLIAYRSNNTIAVLQDADQQQWTERTSHIQPFTMPGTHATPGARTQPGEPNHLLQQIK